MNSKTYSRYLLARKMFKMKGSKRRSINLKTERQQHPETDHDILIITPIGPATSRGDA